MARWKIPPTGLLLVSDTRSFTSSSLVTFLVDVMISAPKLCKKIKLTMNELIYKVVNVRGINKVKCKLSLFR